METIREFKKQQAQTVEILKKLLDFLREGEEYGVEIEQKLMQKIEAGIKATADEKLKVALIGGFSEGKTSIAAAWAEKYDKSTMKINQQESSDSVAVYSMDDFDLIDTPGLFGFKETSSREKYKEITRKYVSEAHLVLYVMNPNNPVKESHKEELVWLFKDLNLLPRTVFILSRFDEEVDIEDDDDYEKGLAIKRQNITSRLKDFDLISNDELTIVAVSANPFEKGIEYWLSHLDNFKKLSRIGSLQKATTEKIKAAGTSAALIEESKKSIISDILIRELPIAIARDEETNVECNKLQQLCNKEESEMKQLNDRLSEARVALREFIKNLYSNLILQGEGLSLETASDFYQKNIGKDGIVLSTNIKNEFERHLDIAYNEIHKMQISLDAGIQQYNTIMGQMAKGGIKKGAAFLSKGVNITNETVKNARNFIAPTFKFKPWGAVKLAGKINAALPIIGAGISLALEVWDAYKKDKAAKEFRQGVSEMILGFEEQREEYLAFINDDEKFISECFPNYPDVKKRLEQIHTELQVRQAHHEKFKTWRKHGEAIAAEFKAIS